MEPSQEDKSARRTVKRWVEEALGESGENATILVAELRCTETGCAPVETVVAVFREGTRSEQKFACSAKEMTEADVRRVFGHERNT